MTLRSEILALTRSLLFRLWLLLTAVFILTYASISLIVFYGVKDFLQKSAEQGLQILASERLNRLDSQFSNQITNLHAWAKLEVMDQLLTGDIDQRIALTLTQMKQQYRLPGNIYAFDSKGRLVAASTRHPAAISRMPALWQTALQSHAGFVTKHRDLYDGQEDVAFIAPVHASFAPKERIGTLVLAYPWSSVASQLGTPNASMIVLDRLHQNRVLFSGMSPVVLSPMIGDLMSGHALLRGENGHYLAACAPGNNGGEFARYAPGMPPVLQGRWSVCAVQPLRNDWLAPLALAWRWILLSGLLLGVPMGLLILWLSRRFLKPITDLTGVAVDISASADLSHHAIEVKSRDEIGLLQQSFNRMLARMQKAFQERARTESELEAANEKLLSMAMTDSLTGLANRRAAEERFTEETARAKRHGYSFALAICDLDNFKLVNDHYGHEVGDRLLKHAAEILRNALRLDDWVARWGGEEFVLFMHRVDEVEAVVTAERARMALKSQPLDIDHATIAMTASFGVSVLKGDEMDVHSALAEADERLYSAKKMGRDRVVGPQRPSGGVLKQASDLQLALRENRVIPAYQVIVDLQSQAVVANEALARLVMPDGRLLSAGQFIEAAEDTHLIHQVDEAISRQAMRRCCENMCRNRNTRIAHFINLSPNFLERQDLVESLLDLARSCRGAPCDACPAGAGARTPFVVEVTERQLIVDFKALRQKLQPLIDAGFRLALDDFGSGYSSFLYLSELPVSFLKIDGWMVQNMRSNPTVLAAVESIVNLARRLRITTIAEFVEDGETARLLRELGVNWGQGHYFGMPQRDAPAQAR